MRPFACLGLPSSLLLSIAAQVNANHPTAIRKMSPDAAEKLLPDDLAFASDDMLTAPLSPSEELLAARIADDPFLHNISYPYRPPFAEHGPGASHGWERFRRAAEALHILESRQACPTNMVNCENIGSPNKCCMSNEVCVTVDNEDVGNVACCPQGASCNGPVGTCPDGSPSCAADLGGGCCIPGYVCQGVGCVPSPPPAPSTSPTRTATNGGGGGGGGGVSSPVETITTVSTTTLADGNTMTVIVTVVVTATPGPITTTTTTTSTATPSITGAVPPFRPTSTADGDDNPTYCPTGFYACLARAGGGCCQTGRDCATTSCPPAAPSTTIITNGVTVVVPVSDVPGPQPTKTCANGWFLCGAEGGSVPGCCPSGYECGTASCTTVSATRTGEIQKGFPNAAAASRPLAASFVVAVASILFALI